MSRAVITISDVEGSPEDVDVHLELGEAAPNPDSTAHNMALKVLDDVLALLQPANDDTPKLILPPGVEAANG